MNTLIAEQFVWHQPSVWLLTLLLLIPFIAWRMFAKRYQPAATVSTTAVATSLKKTWRIRLIWLPDALRLLALALLIIAIARPQIGNAHTESYTEGIAIQMLVDRSGSMRAMDFKLDGQPVDRLTAIKDVATKFIEGDESQLEGRNHDLVGIVSFARYADQNSPMTLDHDYLKKQLDELTIGDPNHEGSATAIGDAIGLAAERMDALTRKAGDETGEKVEGKIMILLTDGENNAGELDPEQAAKVAKALGIRIYTIGVGTNGRAPVPYTDPFGRQRVDWQQVRIDEATLQKVALATGGQYFRATDTESLKNIYEEIDKLEKTKVQQQHFVDYRELAIKPFYAGSLQIPPILLMALVIFFVECVLRQTLLKRVP